MLQRLLLTLLLLAITAGFLDHRQKAGSFQKVDQAFLDFMVANARENFDKSLPDHDGVVLVELRAEDHAEYASWPPPPLDWQTLVRGLQEYDPEVLVIATPLNWGRPTPDFAPALADALLPFTSVILGVEAQLADGETSAPAFLGDLDSLLPRFIQVDGDASRVPSLASLITAPDAAVRASSEMGLLCLRQEKGTRRLPYAVKDQDAFIPTLLAQTLARHSHSPYSSGHRLHLGAGAGAYLQEGRYVPLRPSGEFIVTPQATVPTVNALHLMAGSLADAVSDTEKALLAKADILVLGITQAESLEGPPSLPRLYAQAFHHLLGLPRLQKLGSLGQWIIQILAVLAALWLIMRVPPEKVLKSGLFLFFLAFIGAYLLFQASLISFSPVPPSVILVLGMLLGRFWRKKETTISLSPSSPASQDTVAT
ncbi:CHASE2 domain-containing sensor protein [Prosthecobacter fusiformis]|uniref:CHASE2 domain-containing sensor protein n=1 Tax=Prosthecobacter fusiformis TaxID=48464 RepID=A0A4R7SQE2_9BACT|nr:CHASE2 domain-containing protein [Prosthecobacter fusiformis]TDU80809.1 CHASE2 domain-containing sensor protein [Prosthecobacter fusiformis]